MSEPRKERTAADRAGLFNLGRAGLFAAVLAVMAIVQDEVIFGVLLFVPAALIAIVALRRYWKG